MTKEYYTPVQFPELEPETSPLEIPEADPEAFRVAVTGVLLEVNREIVRIKSGTSKLLKYVPQDKGGDGPVYNALRLLTENPTKESLEQFIVISNQDFGRGVAKHFIKLFSEVDSTLERLVV